MSQVQLPIQFLPVAGQEIPSVAVSPEGQFFMAELEGEQIVLRMSPDRGGFWGNLIPVPNATSPKAPSIAFMQQRLFIAWISSDGTNTLYYTFSDNNGQNFQPVTRVSDVVTVETPVLIGGPFASVVFKQEDGRIGMVILS